MGRSAVPNFVPGVSRSAAGDAVNEPPIKMGGGRIVSASGSHRAEHRNLQHFAEGSCFRPITRPECQSSHDGQE